MIKKTLVTFLMIFIIIGLVNAQEDLDLKQKIDLASSDIDGFFGSIDHANINIIRGRDISLEDKVLFNLIKSKINMQGLVIIKDINNIDYEKNLVLLGSKKTNKITRELESRFENRTKKKYSPLIIETANIGEQKILMIYSKKEDSNAQNFVAKKSPLNNIMDEKYVPAAATFLSILLMYLWQVFSKTMFDFVNEAISV